MTQTPTDALTVTPEDREAYLSLNMLPPWDAEAVRAGKWDGVTGMQVLARHRLDHTTPEPVLRWEGDVLSVTDADKQFAADWNYECRHCSEYEGDFEADLAAAVAEYREQSVRDWLARAGLGGVAGEPVAWIYEYGGGIVAVTATCYDPGVLKALGWTETPLYAHPPASPTAEVVEALTASISEYDAVVKACPANKTFLGDKACPKCKAERNEGCREEIRACFSFLSNARTALAKVQP